MGNSVRKYRWIENWRIGELESYLTDMAAQGLHLQSLGVWFIRFERGRPEETRYRIDFSFRQPGSGDEQRELYAESGWEYVCEQRNLRLYRSPAAQNAPEIHTDPAEQAYTLQVLDDGLRAHFSSTAASTLGIFGVMGGFLFVDGTPLLSFVRGSGYWSLSIAGCMCVYDALQVAVSAKKLIRSMREGRGIDHSADWKRRHRIAKITLLIFLVLTPVVIVPSWLQLTARHSKTLALNDGNRGMIRLADIEPDPALAYPPPVKEDIPPYGGHAVTSEWSLLAPVMRTGTEQGVIAGRMWPDGSGAYNPSIYCEIYQLRFSGMADGIIRDLGKRYRDFSASEWVEETDRTGFDRLLLRSEEMRLDVFASRGGAVVYLRYNGNRDVEAVIQAVAGFLSRM